MVCGKLSDGEGDESRGLPRLLSKELLVGLVKVASLRGMVGVAMGEARSFPFCVEEFTLSLCVVLFLLPCREGLLFKPAIAAANAFPALPTPRWKEGLEVTTITVSELRGAFEGSRVGN